MAKERMSEQQQQLEEENLKLRKVVGRLKHLTNQYRSAEVIQNALFRISELAAEVRDMDSFYRSVHEIIGKLMFAKNFYICLHDSQQEVVNFVYFVDEVDQDTIFEQLPVETLSSGLTGYILRTGRSLLCPPEVFGKLIEDGEVKEMGAAPVDWLGVPLKSQDTVIGVMVVQSYNDECRYSEKDEDLLTFVSQHVVNALERLKQQELMQNEIEHQTAELRHANESLMKEITEREKAEQQTAVLFAISELTNTSDNMTTFYKSLHKEIGTLIHADNFYVALLSPDKKHLHFPYHVDETGAKAERRRVSRGLTEYVFRKREAVFINARHRQQLIEDGEVTPGTGGGELAKQWLGSPLMLNGEVFGVIAVQTYDNEFLYKADDLELLNFVSQHVAVAIDRKRSADEIQRVNQFLEKKVTERTEELVSEIERRKKIEARLFHDAHHDSLTGLPNRALFTERLQQALAHKRRHVEHHFAVLFLDLDRFKNINDTLGHSAGDEFLLDVSKRITDCVRDNDMVARLGGDEFVVLLDTMSSIEDAKEIAKRMIKSLSDPFNLNGQEHYSGASVGIALCRDDKDTVERLLRDADAAMYQAKTQGRGRYVLFDEQMHQSLVDSVRRETALRHAKIEEDFDIEYEDIVDFRSNERVGVEMHLRWNDERQALSSDEFLPLAEKTGQIIKLDRYVLKRCCERIAKERHNRLPRLHVNLSARHLIKTGYVNQLIETVERYKIAPEAIAFEFSETALTQNDRRSLASLRRLAEKGFTLVIDDFGRGAGPLQYLYNYPFSILKLDQNYVSRLKSNERARAMLKHVVTLCDELGISLYAAGIDTQEEFSHIQDLGVYAGQGKFVEQYEHALTQSNSESAG
ncbi:diguanylate cyclase domain-containing protein [Idiomarina seosinensis]|nr:EAL domain-containing protein [Idiomarina seosinensis]